MRYFNIAMVVILTISMIGGCANKKGKRVGADGATTEGIEPGSELYGEETKGLGEYADAPWNDPQNPLSDKVVYFKYDSSEVQSEYTGIVATHAAYLAAHSDLVVTLEGHADERGSREYNIALSEQRAHAVARMMKLQGVGESQIQIVSYGEEKPADFGHDERAWSMNRRVEITYPN